MDDLGNAPHTFLSPGGPCADRIATLDWSLTSVGPLEKWPQSLRSMTSFLIGSDVPMVILWGCDGRMIYNDAYAVFTGGADSAAMGSPVHEAWPELFELNPDLLTTVLSGRTLSYRDQHFVALRANGREDIWLNLDASPVRDDAGQPSGVVIIAKDTTARVRTEQRLRIAQEAGGVGTFEWYPDTGRLDVSDEYRRIWGLDANVEVTDMLLVDLLHPDDRSQSGPAKLGSSNPLDYVEYRRFDPESGEIRWIARRGEVISKLGSSVRRFIGIAIDITARKAIEAEVRESEAKWRGLFEQMQEAFFVGEAVRDSSGRMTDFVLRELNPAFETQTGIAVADAVDRRMREVEPGVPETLIEAYARVLDTGEPALVESHFTDRGNRWFEARVRALDGERFAVLFVDISARKNAERLVLESEARFRALAQSMPNHVWTATPDGRRDWFNERIYAYSGLPEGSLDNDGWAAMVHAEDLPEAAEAWAQACRLMQPYEAEFRLRRHDGTYRWHIGRAVLIRDAGGAADRWIGTNTDIDGQKVAEATLAEFALTLEQRVEARTAELLQMQDALRQSQKMESIGNLTGGVAHDFNNLLQVINGNLQLLFKDIAGNDRAEGRVRNAMEGVARGSRLASQLLAFGRRQPLAPKVVNLARLIRNMDEMMRRALGASVQIETVISGGLWNTEIDPGNVENAILNLAINARDAMDGEGKLTIEAGNAYLDDQYARSHADVEAGQYVMLAVSDTGSGISPDLIEKVFEPFFSTKPEGKGTGLGLSMVYGFVKQSGGHIKIYSEPGYGTTVKLYMPRSMRAEDQLVAIESGPVIGGDETILVAEDDNAVRETVIATLKDLGYRVLQAPDAQSALTIVESGVPIDLLFTDVVMPGTLKSADLARRAIEILPNLGVLFTSGYTENSIVHSGRLDEGVELLSKPYTREALAYRLRHVFANVEQRKKAGAATPPLSAAQDAASEIAGPAKEEMVETIAKKRSLSILVCEDDVLIRMSTVDMLEDMGHVVSEAADGKGALAALEAKPIDILITDIGLPDMSGVTLAERARAQLPDLPVIFATGHSQVEGVVPGPTTGLITKPYWTDTLEKAISAVVATDPS